VSFVRVTRYKMSHGLEGMRVRCFHDGRLFFGRVWRGVCSECGEKVVCADDSRLKP